MSSPSLSPSNFNHKRQGSDASKLIETDDLWSKGVAAISVLQKQGSLGRQGSLVRRPSLDTVLEGGLDDPEEPLVDRQLSVLKKYSSSDMKK